MPKRAASIVLVLVLCPAAWGAEPAATAAEPSGAAQPTEPGDDEIIGQFVLVLGAQSTTVGALDGANLSGMVLAAADNLPDFTALTGMSCGETVLCGPGGFGELLRGLLANETGDSFMMAFTPEAMRMDEGGQSLIWTAGSPATMGLADHENGELLRDFPLDRRSDPELTTGQYTPPSPGSTEEAEETSPSGQATTVSYVSSFSTSGNNSLSFSIAEANALEHNVHFVVSLGKPGIWVRQHHLGKVWLAPEIPGQSIIAAFYDNFAGAIANSGWLGDFAGGLTQVMASSRGIPMRGNMEMTTITRAAGLQVLRQKTTKEWEVGAVWLLPLSSSMLRYISTFQEEIALGYEPMEIETMTGEETQGFPGTVGAAAKMWKDGFKKQFGFGKSKKKDED